MIFSRLQNWLFLFLLMGSVFSCSTEKNTVINRFYHGMTAHYNGYFNANELIRQSVEGYRTARVEDFYVLLPIEPVPNEDEVIGMYPAIDTAISKCAKVIQRHSMPSNDVPALKKEEHNGWIDENWTTIGVANYYRRDYYAALKAFNYIKKFYVNDPSLHIGELWTAKTNIALGKYTDAGFNLSNLNQAIEDEKAGKTGTGQHDKRGKEIQKATVPKRIYCQLEQTKAELALVNNEPDSAIIALESALDYAKKQDKARLHFIIAQLYEKLGKRTEAKSNYSAVLKYNAPYAMHFNARLKRAFMGGDERVKKELYKMLRDQKNAQFKDQIYYALADISLQEKEREDAKRLLTKSAFYSVSNNRQKGMAYEQLGNLSFEERNYIFAQKYFDSCVAVIDDRYPNVDGVRTKAEKLADLVAAVELAAYEDSVQRIARMPEKDRVNFIEEVIKQIKREELIRKQQEADRLLALQQLQRASVQESPSGNKWYFNNSKTRTAGYDEFRKLWGPRENEDNWRRSDKTVLITDASVEIDSTSLVSASEKEDTLTVERLLQNIPLTDSTFKASEQRMLSALLESGIIYKDQLGEPDMAKEQFLKVRSRKTLGEIDLTAAYNLFKLYEGLDPKSTLVTEEKNYILTTYATSDYAHFIQDPDFFIKRKAQEVASQQGYLKILEKYRIGHYHEVIIELTKLMQENPTDILMPNYMLLKVMATGHINQNKSILLPELNALIQAYPNSEEAQRAADMVSIITTGYSKNETLDFSKKTLYIENLDAKHWVVIMLNKSDQASTAKVKVSDFHREFFSKQALKVSTKVFGDDQDMILIQDFEHDKAAKDYIRIFKLSKKHVNNLKGYRIFAITQENLKILFETRQLQEYELFHDEFY
jgi:hypothetical protein